MEAIGSANYINLVPNRSVIHAAADNKFLIQSGGLSDFMKKQIIFYESHTPFARGIAKIDSSDFILGFKDQSTGVVDTSSWNSACISVSTNNNPSAAVGKDAGEIKCEEMSEFENFDDFMDVTTPTLKTGSVLTGFLNAWGTAGKANKGWAVFEQNFYDPRSGSFMALKMFGIKIVEILFVVILNLIVGVLKVIKLVKILLLLILLLLIKMVILM